MNIECVEIRNFRRLAAVRIDFSDGTTLFVGPNNSGKTSAFAALQIFLASQKALTTYDISIAHWDKINQLGKAYETPAGEQPKFGWRDLLPSLDVWLRVSDSEIHRVCHLIPTLDWKSEDGIGVRLQLEPRNADELRASYVAARAAAAEALREHRHSRASPQGGSSGVPEEDRGRQELSLWPEDLMDFLSRRMSTALTVNAYLLDPARRMAPVDGIAQPQVLPADSTQLDGDPFDGLIRVDDIPAHRPFDDYSAPRGGTDEPGPSGRSTRHRLTAQLQQYYRQHVDPAETPKATDIKALEAIKEAQIAFDEQLREYFSRPLNELEGLGYPGVANPRLVVSTSLRPVEGLNHQSAVQYEVSRSADGQRPPERLPEQCNGLGYQNLISMVFELISFRDAWLDDRETNQIERNPGEGRSSPPPLHLVLVEEPEVHLHVQVQQVFIRKAYEVLLNDTRLANGSPLATQLVVTTHSSHIAHQVSFADMRYFRRHPNSSNGAPTSSVINLSEVFGTPDETARFVSRYLQATHADLFFADGAILVEGASERILLPHFIRNHFTNLRSCYISILDVGGSHAHRLEPLIGRLGLNSLIITDIDAVEKDPPHRSARPKRGAGLITDNDTLTKWHPREASLDKLLDLPVARKERICGQSHSVRVAYQKPVQVSLGKERATSEGIPRTFEDSLALENIDLFRETKGTGLMSKFREAIETSTNISELGDALLGALDPRKKAELALDMLCLEDPSSIKIPEYIREGLQWLENKLALRQMETAPQDTHASQKAADEGQ